MSFEYSESVLEKSQVHGHTVLFNLRNNNAYTYVAMYAFGS